MKRDEIIGLSVLAIAGILYWRRQMQIKEAKATAATGVVFMHPLKDAPVVRFTSGFETPTRPNHHGIDFGVPVASPVSAFAAGEVVARDYQADGAGNYLIVKHPNAEADGTDLFTAYFHLSEFLVKQGDKVQAGQIIGKSGNTGHSTGPHLHFEIRKTRFKDWVDPAVVLEALGLPLNWGG